MKCAKKFQKYLESKDYKYDIVEKAETTVINFPYKGKDVRLFFSGNDGEYLSIYTVFESVPNENSSAALLACNEMNTKFKWVTFYLDSDNDIIAHLDAKLTVGDAAEEAMEMLVRHIDIMDKAKPTLMKAIYA